MKSPEQKSPVLDFDSFKELNAEDMPRYNNFFMFFFDDPFFGQMYREKPYFERFKKEHPDFEEELTSAIGKANRDLGTLAMLKPFEKKLYEAYKIMRSYGVSDQELFS